MLVAENAVDSDCSDCKSLTRIAQIVRIAKNHFETQLLQQLGFGLQTAFFGHHSVRKRGRPPIDSDCSHCIN